MHYGVFCATGIALTIEGSPLGGLPHLSLPIRDGGTLHDQAVQNRHPDVNGTAYAIFTVLEMAIFLGESPSSPFKFSRQCLKDTLGVWIVFVVIYSFLCVYISFKIYFVSFVFDGFKQLKKTFTSSDNKVEAIASIKKGRFILLIVANLINYAMLITGLCLYNSGVTDLGTFLLGLLMGNSVVYAVFYTSTKVGTVDR
jgi:hypothetical protein